MKFYSDSYNLIVMHSHNELCRFKNFEFETNDEIIIEKLKELNYKHDEVILKKGKKK